MTVDVRASFRLATALAYARDLRRRHGAFLTLCEALQAYVADLEARLERAEAKAAEAQTRASALSLRLAQTEDENVRLQRLLGDALRRPTDDLAACWVCGGRHGDHNAECPEAAF